MIEVFAPEITKMGTEVRLSAVIHRDGMEKTLWYQTTQEYGAYFCTERADAFLVALFPYALLLGEDIRLHAPVSEALLHSLQTYEMPFLCGLSPQYHAIGIEAETACDGIANAGHVGTGISCGVDCLSTLIRHGIEETRPHYKIDTLALFNTGYYGDEVEKKSDSYRRYVDMAEDFSKRFQYRFLYVDSNVAEIVRMDFSSVVTFLTNSVVLALQKYFSCYYFASSTSILAFDPIVSESSSYDLLTMQCISTETLRFFSGSNTMTRVEKTRLIADYPEIFEWVYPCMDGNPPKNCGRCEKCRRTIMAMDAIGRLEQAKTAFDLTYYQKHHASLYAYMLVREHPRVDPDRAPLYREIHEELKKNKRHIPLLAWVYVPYQFYRAKWRRPLRAFARRVINGLRGSKRTKSDEKRGNV